MHCIRSYFSTTSPPRSLQYFTYSMRLVDSLSPLFIPMIPNAIIAPTKTNIDITYLSMFTLSSHIGNRTGQVANSRSFLARSCDSR